MTGTDHGSVDVATILTPSDAAVLVADDEACFQQVNENAVTLLKYSEQELKGMHVWDITPGAQIEQAQQMWRDFLARGRQAGVYQVRRADGRYVTVQYEATANFRPGQHISVLMPTSRARGGSRPLDECPFDRPFPVDFDHCPAYQPVLLEMLDSHEHSVGQIATCRHLTTSRLENQPGFYARCGLGDAIQRSRWLTTAAGRGLLKVRELRTAFYREAQAELRQLIAARAASRSTPGSAQQHDRLRAASDLVMAALAAFTQRRNAELAAAGLDPATLRRAIEATLQQDASRGTTSALAPSREAIAGYPMPVQAFLRPDLVASRLMAGSPKR